MEAETPHNIKLPKKLSVKVLIKLFQKFAGVQGAAPPAHPALRRGRNPPKKGTYRMKLILASQSPRRKEILENLGLEFEIVTSDADESSSVTDPYRLVEELSRRKGKAVRELLLSQGRDLRDTVIIASDTVVSIDGDILGKPRDKKDAERMLKLLSGREHEVVSGICLIGKDTLGTSHEITKVIFDEMDEKTIDSYIEKAQPYDKAGAYAIQGLASAYISGIKGDYFNVVGLPVHALCQLFAKMFKENLL